MGPINAHTPIQVARAYIEGLSWPLALGRRFRPRQGCTCEEPDCPTPGAHPAGGAWTWLTPSSVGEALEGAPGASLIAPTLAFDALLMPRDLGMAAMLSLERVAVVPCFLQGDRAGLLMLPATGRYVARHPLLELRSGLDDWVALPPSHGSRWDTPPWCEQTGRPLPLLHAGEVDRHLRPILAMYPACAAPSDRTVAPEAIQ